MHPPGTMKYRRHLHHYLLDFAVTNWFSMN